MMVKTLTIAATVAFLSLFAVSASVNSYDSDRSLSVVGNVLTA